MLDWWDSPSFERYDASLVFGSTWYPVDEGLVDDPDYFAVKWNAWLRAPDATTASILVGAATDAWVVVDGAVVVQVTDSEYETETFEISVDDGQQPIEVYFAHRRDIDPALHIRFVDGEVKVCAPEYDED